MAQSDFTKGISPDLDAWIEKYRLPDGARRETYETVSSKTRATFKQAMAIWTWRFHELSSSYQTNNQKTALKIALTGTHQNLSLNLALRAMDFVVIVVDENYPAAARLMSLILLPTLCGVKNIYAVIIGNSPSKEIIFTLEMTGVLDAILLKKADLEKFCQSLTGFGGILSLMPEIPPNNMPIIFQEKRKPIICLDEPDQFFHGNLELEKTLRSETDLLLTSKKKACEIILQEKFQHLLCLTPGFEGYWHYHNLSPAAFLSSQEIISPI